MPSPDSSMISAFLPFVCLAHSLPAIGWASDTLQLVCTKCVEQTQSDFISLEKQADKEKAELTDAERAQLLQAVKKRRNVIAKEAHELQLRAFAETAKWEAAHKLYASTKAKHKADTELLGKTLKFLNDEAARATLTTLKDAFAGAKQLFDAKERMDSESQALLSSLEPSTDTLARLQAGLQAKNQSLARLDYAQAPGAELGPLIRALLKHVDGVTAATRADAADIVSPSYSAFRGAAELSVVEQVLAIPLKPFNGIFVSQWAVELDVLRDKEFNCVLASLADDGTLCLVSGSQMSFSEIVLVNLRTKEFVKLSQPLMWACAHGGRLYCARGDALVHHAPLSDVFTGRPFDSFETFSIPHALRSVCLDGAADGYILGTEELVSKRLVRIDLATRKHSYTKLKQDTWVLGSLTGIRLPGVLCMSCSPQSNGPSGAVRANGAQEALTSDLSGYPALLPSAARPDDLSAAAVIDRYGNVFYKGEVEALKEPVKPSPTQSLVRVHGDVFLCLDAATKRWKALRIAVP